MSLPPPVRVVGCGSENGDDAVGWTVIDALERQRLQAGVELHKIGGGEQLVDLLDGRGSLVLIDAVRSAHAPGTIHRLRWPWTGSERPGPASTHAVDPFKALQLAEALGRLPRDVLLFGVTAEQFAPGQVPSPPIAAAASKLVEEVRYALAVRWPGG